MASGAEADECGGEDLALAGGLAGNVGGLEAVANLGVAAEGSSAATRDVAEDEVEEAFGGGEGGGVGVEGADLACGGFETGREGVEATGVGVGGEQVGGGVAVGEDEGLAARSGAGVPDARWGNLRGTAMRGGG